jgi:hypothetical protein
MVAGVSLVLVARCDERSPRKLVAIGTTCWAVPNSYVVAEM